MPDNPLWGWLGPLVVALFGGFLRFYHLGAPHAVVFDETYYAKHAFSLITHGVERKFVDDADSLMLHGSEHLFKTCETVQDCAVYAMHPPLGNWMIGVGEWLFGLTPFGWRFMPALVGTMSVLILARVARRMTRSTLLGCLAGFLLALDGLHFVLSRTALLDIFLMFWVLAGFACLLVDRERVRERLVEWHAAAATPTGPRLGLRPWRLAAGLCLGAALATKWTGLFFILAFGVMTLVWDAGARRAVGLRRLEAARLDWPLGAAWLGVVPIVVYVASFGGWLATAGGWGRDWDGATSPGRSFLIDSLRSLVTYQLQLLGSHTGLSTHHDYQSDPWTWPLLLRPAAFFYEKTTAGCGADECFSSIVGAGTPLIWYAALPALAAMIGWYLAARDWRAGAVLLAYGMGWLPWFYYAIADHRTMYLFYMLPVLPFMILAIVLSCGLIMGTNGASSERRTVGVTLVGAFALLALVNFWWISPILSAEPLTYSEWLSRMFLRSWI
ncbi:dolichyl-phosphate-mannose--protein mannosyltransferase [Sphaerimonospora thailandensis]|uniref:Polyprenol-phosphate-mannose--protein mannosyltransferase n=1 Tax=Sphaerimonospora thailandensis TaxID=795644 RepID=A0A8J3REX8_9ACTN|nr:phospholipid carrier-dependent glycosyltransferase [Sphaerimonospora thailandensis]GIH71173.1 phospholipid carrier-dependent glycosyltransferase [Sphaerimonospora thailandensis]